MSATPAGPGEHPAPAHQPAAFRRALFLLVLSVFIVAFDLGTKQWALGALSRERAGKAPAACTVPNRLTRIRGEPVEVVAGHVSLEYTENCGGAFGLLGGSNESMRFPFFIVVSLVAIYVIISVFRKLEPRQKLLKWALPLVLGGAVGNLYDRLVYRFVVDFIKVQLNARYVWPTFNVADAAITIGVGLMVLDMFGRRKPASVAAPVPAPVASAETEPREAQTPDARGDVP